MVAHAREKGGRQAFRRPANSPLDIFVVFTIIKQYFNLLDKDVFMYALVEIKGKQYKAEKDSLLKVDLLDTEPGSALDIDSVLLISGDTVTVGDPYVQGARVSAVVERHERDKKIIVFKYKPKKDYRRTKGHRQGYSIIKIKDIVS